MKSFAQEKNKLLLHVCCAGCGVYIAKILARNFVTTLFFYNPNIFPQEEYRQRLAEAKKIAQKFNLPLIVGDYDHQSWLDFVAGHENDLEKGERCRLCYQYRLNKTFAEAKSRGFNYVTTTLSVSPHKDYKLISQVGEDLAAKYGINFLNQDFKKQDGFKKSTQLSRELNLYRQNYCGCEFSRTR